MQQSSFSILKSAYPELYQLAVEAEKYAHSDHSGFLLKIRMFLEIWCHEIAYKCARQNQIEPKLFDKIEQLRTLSLIDHEQTNYVHNIRIICNKGVHITFDLKRGFCQVLEIADHEINQCLSAIYRLSALLIGEATLTAADGLRLSDLAKLDAAIAQGFMGDGKACLTAVKVMHKELQQQRHKSRYSEADLQYWLNKALHNACLEALEFYAQLVAEKRFRSFDLKTLQKWLVQFSNEHKNTVYALTAARTFEKLGDMKLALLHFNTAAENGCFHSIKRLQDYWIKRDYDVLFNVIKTGDRFNERRSVYYMLIFLIFHYSSDEFSVEEKAGFYKKLKQQYVKAKAFGVEGLGYAEALLAKFELLDFACDATMIKEKVAKHWQSAPRYFDIDYLVFSSLGALQIAEPFMIDFAQAIVPLSLKPVQTAELEFELACLQMYLTKHRKAYVAKRNSRELFKSAAKQGCREAKEMLARLNGRYGKAAAPEYLSKKRLPVFKKTG
jgi:hypothetical protein